MQAFAAGGDRLRIELYPPVGGVRLSVVCAGGRALALVPAERSYWEGSCEPDASGGGGGFGLPRGAAFWTRVLLGEVPAAGDDDAGARVRIEPGRAGEPPLRVEAELAREDGRRAMLTLLRQSLLPPAGDEAFRPEIPQGFSPLEALNLLDLLVPDETAPADRQERP
jgi:hypothetical protein